MTILGAPIREPLFQHNRQRDMTSIINTPAWIAWLQSLKGSPSSLPWVTPEQFGAKGDGIYDDALAIQAAHDSLPSTGGTIVLSNKTYYAFTQMNFTKTIRLIGQGIQSTTLHKKAAMNTVIFVNFTYSGGELCGFTITSDANLNYDGIYVQQGNRLHVHDIQIDSQKYNGISIYTSNSNICKFDHLILYNNGNHGMAINSVDANAMTISNIDTRSNGVDGISILRGSWNFLHGIVAQSNARYGVYINNGVGNFGELYLEGSGVAGLYLDTSASKNQFFVSPLSGITTDASTNQDNTIIDISNSLTMSTFVGVPASATASGKAGQWSANTNYLYVCYATNTWRRVAIAGGW